MIKSRLQGPAIRCYFSSIYGEQAGSLPLARRGIFPALWRNARSLVTTERAPPNYTKFFSASSASPRETLPISSYIPRPRRSVPLHHCSCFPLILSTLWLQPAYSPSHAPHPSQAFPSVGGACFVMPRVRALRHNAGSISHRPTSPPFHHTLLRRGRGLDKGFCGRLTNPFPVTVTFK